MKERAGMKAAGGAGMKSGCDSDSKSVRLFSFPSFLWRKPQPAEFGGIHTQCLNPHTKESQPPQCDPNPNQAAKGGSKRSKSKSKGTELKCNGEDHDEGGEDGDQLSMNQTKEGGGTAG